MNRESHPPTLGLEGGLLGPVLSRQPKGFLILPTPALKPHAPSPQTRVREGNLLAPAHLTLHPTFPPAALTGLAAALPGEQPGVFPPLLPSLLCLSLPQGPFLFGEQCHPCWKTELSVLAMGRTGRQMGWGMGRRVIEDPAETRNIL